MLPVVTHHKLYSTDHARPASLQLKVTDKKIKLHIVSDFKVNINSLSAFVFPTLGGGKVFKTSKQLRRYIEPQIGFRKCCPHRETWKPLIQKF